MDENVQRFRDEITALDRAIFDALNRRLELVADLKRYKAENDIAFVDPNRETEMVEERVAAFDGLGEKCHQAHHPGPPEINRMLARKISDRREDKNRGGQPSTDPNGGRN